MSWNQSVQYLIGKPVGVSLTNGQGVSGILCNIQGGEIYLLEYLYQTQFATKHYPFSQIQSILPYPGCYRPQSYQSGPLY